ncbi:hypothetical protein [Vulcanisaeta sp. JCM 16161]|uniref:hypothetical protein n=1 Tax=Vulcanisaeta sp. JCM 16161 TaxID=1295372 RepID=UPI001FB51805|nr:hypothetical protein [Vulcanisaeta sp. JCM 16161]
MPLQGIASRTSGSASNLGFTHHSAVIIEPENYEVRLEDLALLTYDPSVANENEIKIRELKDGIFYIITNMDGEVHLVRKVNENIEFYTAHVLSNGTLVLILNAVGKL